MNVNTPETRQLAWIRANHPKLYSFIAAKRPDLIRDASTRVLNGLGGIDGWTDDLLNLAKQAIPVYQQQQVFKTQLKQASAAATPVAAATVPAAPISLTPAARGGFSMMMVLPIIAAAGIAAYFLLARKSKRR